jgi:hypothetical protein
MSPILYTKVDQIEMVLTTKMLLHFEQCCHLNFFSEPSSLFHLTTFSAWQFTKEIHDGEQRKIQTVRVETIEESVRNPETMVTFFDLLEIKELWCEFHWAVAILDADACRLSSYFCFFMVSRVQLNSAMACLHVSCSVMLFIHYHRHPLQQLRQVLDLKIFVFSSITLF